MKIASFVSGLPDFQQKKSSKKKAAQKKREQFLFFMASHDRYTCIHNFRL